jgi:hypothetical protein
MGLARSRYLFNGELELRRGDDLGTLTLWANGMVDFDVLRPGQPQPRSSTRECDAPEELSTALDVFLQEFVDAV